MASRQDSNLPNLQAMAEFRYQIRRFLRISEHLARGAGIKPQQYQLMLAIKGVPEGSTATVGDIAEKLQIQHHSTVELVDRLAARGLVRRKRAGEDRRQVMLELTPKGEKLLRDLAQQHRDELVGSAPALVSALKNVLSGVKRSRRAGRRSSRS